MMTSAQMIDLRDRKAAILQRLADIPEERKAAWLPEQMAQLAIDEAECRAELAEVDALLADGEGSPEAFVVSKNLYRRHLNEEQRAFIAAKLPALKRGSVKAQRAGGTIAPPVFSTHEAAELLNVGSRMVKDAKTVLKEGTPDEIAAVEEDSRVEFRLARERLRGASA